MVVLAFTICRNAAGIFYENWWVLTTVLFVSELLKVFVTVLHLLNLQWFNINFGDGEPFVCRGLFLLILRVSHRRLLCLYQGHIETIFDCQFHPEDPDVLATGSFDGTIKIWDMTTLKPVTCHLICLLLIEWIYAQWFVIIMAARQHSWPPSIMFYCCRLDLLSFFLSFFAVWSPRLLGRSSPNFATCSVVTIKIRSDICVAPSFRSLATQKHQNFGTISDTSRLDHEYLRNATRHRQSENGIANYGHSHTGKLNLVYFGLQDCELLLVESFQSLKQCYN